MHGTRRTLFLIFAAMVALGQATPPPAAGERQALLIEGKHTLRQRVLTRPAAKLSPQPGAPAAGAVVPALTPLYVYTRQNAPDGSPWVEVGGGSHGQTMGWLPQARTIPWLHTLTAAFQNPLGRERTLFFRDRDSLAAMLGGGTPATEAHSLAEAAQRTPLPPNFPVVATEPETFVDIHRQFYLLPILQAEQIAYQDGREYRMLEVASVPVSNTPEAPQAFNVGIAFVVDATLSMNPYLDRVRNALNDIVRATSADPKLKPKFALVAFQNSRTAQPRLDYLNRTFATFAQSGDPADFQRRIADVHATAVDSLSFNEDSFAAVQETLSTLDWGGLAAKFIVLVTDAGSRAPNDPYSETHKTPADLGALAKEKGVAILALHLKTPQGLSNHAYAERQYISLTAAPFPNCGPQYFPIDNGDPAKFSEAVAKVIAAVRGASAPPAAGAPTGGAAGGNAGAGQCVALGQGGPAAAGRDPGQAVSVLASAMRLAWLGRQNQAATPDVERAWVADGYRGANPPENLEVRVLLTRNELNDMSQVLKIIIEKGRASLLETNALFDQLQTVAAQMARGQHGVENLGDLMGEYLDGLPYLSNIATMDRETWRSMQTDRQSQFLDELESHLRAYRDFNRTPELWQSFDAAHDPGEAMFPVPLALLP